MLEDQVNSLIDKLASLQEKYDKLQKDFDELEDDYGVLQGNVNEISTKAVADLEVLRKKLKLWTERLTKIHWLMGDKDVPDYIRDEVCDTIDVLLENKKDD